MSGYLPPVTVVMATRNGARHLDEQLASLAAQSHGDWRLRVGDDGSTDATRDILSGFRDGTGAPQEVEPGPERGFAANFLTLIAGCADVPGWVALSDQDDVWYPDKLSRALNALMTLPPERPAVYCARTMLVDQQGRRIGPSRRHRYFTFRNALVQNVVAGNTIVLNPAAHALVARAGAVAVPYHDWWIYLLVTGAGGQVIYDPEPVMDYRQHAGNVQGENRSASAVLRRGGGFLNGTWRSWFEANMAALEKVAPLLNDETSAALARWQARRGPLARTRGYLGLGAYRQRPHETAALYVGSLIGSA